MPRPGKPREQIVEALAGAFRRHGYGGASLAVLSDAAGIGRASLYHHFPGGKEEMALAVLAWLSEGFTAQVLRPLRGPGSLDAQLAGMVRGLDAFYRGGRASCAIEAFTLGTVPASVRRAIREATGIWIGALERTLRRHGMDRDEARWRAETAVMAVQGALVLARASGDRAAFARVLETLPRLLAGNRAPTGRRAGDELLDSSRTSAATR